MIDQPRLDPAVRPGDDPTIRSGSIARGATQRLGRDAWAAARMARRARLTKVRMGRGTHDVSGTWALAWRSALTVARSFNSLFAR